MTPENYECRKCHQGMYVPDGMDPLDEDVRFCEACAIDEIERLQLENEVLRQRLVACDVISLSNTPETFRANRLCQEHPAWSATYVSVCDAIEREMGLREKLDRLQALLSTPPTWLCPDCRNQWIMRDEAEKQPAPTFTDNRDAKPLPPRQGPNGQLKCPGQNCANTLNRHTPSRCPDCLQPIEKPK